MKFRENEFNTMAAPVLPPWVARPSTNMVLTKQDKCVLVFYETRPKYETKLMIVVIFLIQIVDFDMWLLLTIFQ